MRYRSLQRPHPGCKLPTRRSSLDGPADGPQGSKARTTRALPRPPTHCIERRTEMKMKLKAVSAAALVALSAASAHAALERVGPIDTSPSIGGFPAWYQDKTGITLEYCSLTNQAEWDGGWCVLIQ